MTNGKRPVMHFRITPELRARVEACARLEGVSLPEYAREALRKRCEETERLQGQRERARKAAEGTRGGGDGWTWTD